MRPVEVSKPLPEAKKAEYAAAAETPETHDVHETIAALQEEMMQAAEALEFERAAYLRDQIRVLEKMQGGSADAKPSKSARRKKTAPTRS